MGDGIEHHRNAVSGDGADNLFEVLHGDMVGVSVGELGERSQDPRLELHHC